MKKCLYVILFIGSMFLVNTTEVSAQRGCCSHHAGWQDAVQVEDKFVMMEL